MDGAMSLHIGLDSLPWQKSGPAVAAVLFKSKHQIFTLTQSSPEFVSHLERLSAP